MKISLSASVMDSPAMRFAKTAARFRKELVERLGEEKGRAVRYAEAFELCPYGGNLTDEMIRALADKGGCMGVNFAPSFLTMDLEQNNSTIDMLVAQLCYMVKVGGIECAAVGTDFDGIGGDLEINSADKMPMLFTALEKAGFTVSEIEKIAHGNVERVLREAL